MAKRRTRIGEVPDEFRRGVQRPAVRKRLLERKRQEITKKKRALIRQLVLEDGAFEVFLRYIMKQPLEDFHLEMAEHQDKHPRSLILGFRGSWKSTICTEARALFEIVRNPNIRILIASNSVDQAETFLRAIKWHFEHNEELRATFGDFVGTKWTDREIVVKPRNSAQRESTVTCVGVGTALPGRHFDFIIGDDLVIDKNSETEGQREKTRKWFYNVLDPTLDPGTGRMSLLGTRYHTEDFYGYLMDHEMADSHYILSALDENDKSVWEERFSTEELHRKRSADALAFELQYQCTAKILEGAIFKYEDVIQFYEHLPPDSELYYWQAIDPAISQRKDADFFAHATIAIHKPTKKIYIVDYALKKISFKTQVDFVAWEYEKYPQTVRVVIEVNAFQDALRQAIADEYPDIPLQAQRTLKDKVTRAKKLSAKYEQRMVLCKAEHQDYVRHMCEFPNGKHDDLFDAIEMAITRSLKGARKKRRSGDDEVGLI